MFLQSGRVLYKNDGDDPTVLAKELDPFLDWLTCSLTLHWEFAKNYTQLGDIQANQNSNSIKPGIIEPLNLTESRYNSTVMENGSLKHLQIS